MCRVLVASLGYDGPPMFAQYNKMRILPDIAQKEPTVALLKDFDRDTFLAFLPNSDYIVISSHGLEDQICMSDLSPLLKVGDKIDLSGKGVHALSCLSGSKLGRYLVEKCNAFQRKAHEKED